MSGDDDTVVEHLSDHPAGGRGREILFTLLADFERSVGGKGGAAIGIGMSNDANQGSEVISAGDEFLGEEIERRGMVHAVVVREVIQWFDEAASDEFGPDAVDEGAGEVVVAGIGDEVGELLAEFACAIEFAMNVELAAFFFGFLQHRITGATDIGFDGIEKGVE